MSTNLIVLERRKLILVLSQADFGRLGFLPLLFNFSTPKSMTSAIRITESLMFVSDIFLSFRDPVLGCSDFR